MERNIDFELLGVAAVLSRYSLRVPSNQREFSWQEEQVRDLLQDLTNAMRENQETYFLGTIVLTASKDDQWEVADGQQRLATTAMILSVFRDRFFNAKDTLRVKGVEEKLFSVDLKAGDILPRLSLNLDDNEYFINMVLKSPSDRKSVNATRRSHRLIFGAVNTIRSHFDNLESQIGVGNISEALVDWISYLQKAASVIALRVSNATNAFVMFETLNDRGLKTSQADLVKNYLFQKAGDRLGEAQQRWSSMRGAIETIGEEDYTMEYLRLACCVKTGATRERDVMNRVESNAPSKNEAMQLLTFFDSLSVDYAAIRNPDHPKWSDYDESVNKAISTINMLGITQIRPLMLAVAKYFPQKQAEAAFRRLVSWSVRFLIEGIKGGRLDEGYAKLANEIHNGKISSDKALKEAAQDFIPTDAQFKKHFEEARVSVSQLARYYLRSLETTAQGQPYPEFIPNDGVVINLEHIMPLSYNNEWSHVKPQEIETHAKRLGNLALLQSKRNSEAGSLGFKKKKEIYKQSAFRLTAQVVSFEEWGPTQIEQRQKELADLAVRTWPIS